MRNAYARFTVWEYIQVYVHDKWHAGRAYVWYILTSIYLVLTSVYSFNYCTACTTMNTQVCSRRNISCREQHSEVVNVIVSVMMIKACRFCLPAKLIVKFLLAHKEHNTQIVNLTPWQQVRQRSKRSTRHFMLSGRRSMHWTTSTKISLTAKKEGIWAWKN